MYTLPSEFSQWATKIPNAKRKVLGIYVWADAVAKRYRPWPKGLRTDSLPWFDSSLVQGASRLRYTDKAQVAATGPYWPKGARKKKSVGHLCLDILRRQFWVSTERVSRWKLILARLRPCSGLFFRQFWGAKATGGASIKGFSWFQKGFRPLLVSEKVERADAVAKRCRPWPKGLRADSLPWFDSPLVQGASRLRHTDKAQVAATGPYWPKGARNKKSFRKGWKEGSKERWFECLEG